MADSGEAESRRPGEATGSQKVIAATAANSTGATDSFTGPDDPKWRAVELLAEAWQPALDRSYRLGYATGYEAGHAEAERDAATSWALAAALVQRTLQAPTQDDLAARRAS